MKILVFGARGYIAGHLKSIYPDAVYVDIDIADALKVSVVLSVEKPDVVINTAGKTGRPNVDWCEDHKSETLMANVVGPLVLVKECMERGIRFVHVGSGCIYSGDNDGKGWTEEDPPNFFGSFYARSKAWSDAMLREFPVLQVRIRMPFDGTKHPRNLIIKLAKYTKVLDEQNSLTYIPDFLLALQSLIERKASGTYNIVNAGTISPYQVMQRYRAIVDPNITFECLSLNNLPGVVKAGRSNCTLSAKKLASEGIILPSVSDAIEKAMKEIARL